ncbi:MAG: NAD-dependent epimerase/dehydratase family protein [Chloroflexi bacterium]|nr:NAD-dependent epimerase/dehydratase family protein [Chloroflexota bacterium]
MKKVLITGSQGFIGKNLAVVLKRRPDVDLIEFDLDSPKGLLEEALAEADVIYHLAGVNRPECEEAFQEVNYDLTRHLCDVLRRRKELPLLVLSSSTQAALQNPYGLSKRAAEETVFDFGRDTGAAVFVFRLHGVFGKWCRPHYNSVVATFCHSIARDLPITISDPKKEIELVYIDDVVHRFADVLDGGRPVFEGRYCSVEPTHRISLGALAETIQKFRNSRVSLIMPDIGDYFTRVLYATYISYLPADSFAYALTQHTDARGELAELLKSSQMGQIFVSRTRPGITRGNHYHDTKVEKFVVLEGDAVIRFRSILDDEVIEYRVSGREFRVVDIPPGHTHSIENVGESDMIVLFWSDEYFNPDTPDSFSMVV